MRQGFFEREQFEAVRRQLADQLIRALMLPSSTPLKNLMEESVNPSSPRRSSSTRLTSNAAAELLDLLRELSRRQAEGPDETHSPAPQFPPEPRSPRRAVS